MVLLVVMLSSLCGNHDCREHAKFYFIYNPILQYIIPDMPSPKWMISAEEIRFFLKMIPDDEFSPMLRKSFQNEAQHNTIDTVLLQDMQHCCDENHLASIIGLNSMVYNVIFFAREKMSKRGYSTKETARKAPLISYKISFKIFNPIRTEYSVLRISFCQN